MRSYIFTDKELEAVKQYLDSGKRNPTVNKLFHFIRHNKRILTDVQIFLELMAKAQRRSSREWKLPGRPRKSVET